MESFFQSIILGVVQGLTEFLPISSTAHLRVFPSLLNWSDPGTEFSAIIQLGTVLSVIVFFWKDLKKLYGAFFSDLFSWAKGKSKQPLKSADGKLTFWIFIGTIPISVLGLTFKDPIEEGAVRDLNLIGFYLIYFGIMLLISEFLARKNRAMSSITLMDVFLIGVTQAFALVPGASRSGVTILAGLLLGFKRADAARFSFLLGVPAILASGALEVYSLVVNIKSHNSELLYTNLILGMTFAFISGYWSIGFLLKYLQTHRTYIFIFYRVILGFLVIYLNFKGFIH